MTDDTRLRNQPQQQRSLKRFNHILDIAAALFAEQGYDTVTTNHIAAAADVSIGSLYRFFPNKEVILQALMERYLEEMQTIFPQTLDASRPLVDILDEMFGNLLDFNTTHEAFKEMFINPELDARLNHDIHRATVTWVEQLLAQHYPQMQPERRYICAIVGVGIVKGLMPLSEPPASLSAEALKAEMKASVLAYLADFLKREGIPSTL